MNTSTEKTEMDVLMELLEKAEVHGFLMADDVLEAFPEAEDALEQLEDVFISLQEAGVEILDDKPGSDGGAQVEEDEPYEEEDVEFDLSAISTEDTVGLYLKEMARVPLLTIEEEMSLAKQLETGNRAALVLCNNGADSTKRHELEQAIEGGRAARDHLITANTRLVVSIANYELGRQSQQVRASVGILTEQPGKYDRLSAEKNLTIYATLYCVQDVPGQVEKYLRMLGLWERRKDPAGSFSKGMKQKLAFARAILHEPATLFLDEPTAGLDPEAAKLVRDFVEDLKTEGRTIFLCTHNLDEADRLCSQIGVFRQRLIKVDTPSRMKTTVFGRQVEFRLKQAAPALVELVRRFDFVKQVMLEDKR